MFRRFLSGSLALPSIGNGTHDAGGHDAAVSALTAATRDAASLMNLRDRGTLVAGKRADFVVLFADPITNIRNTREIQAVWQAGEQVAGPVANYLAD